MEDEYGLILSKASRWCKGNTAKKKQKEPYVCVAEALSIENPVWVHAVQCSGGVRKLLSV